MVVAVLPQNANAKYICRDLLYVLPPYFRYGTVLSYDSTRVRLQGKDHGRDYINASWVKGSAHDACQWFIAAQGPLRETCNDFWQMLLEQNVTTIVMVTSLEEKSKGTTIKKNTVLIFNTVYQHNIFLQERQRRSATNTGRI